MIRLFGVIVGCGLFLYGMYLFCDGIKPFIPYIITYVPWEIRYGLFIMGAGFYLQHQMKQVFPYATNTTKD